MLNNVAGIIAGFKAGEIGEQTAKRLLREIGVAKTCRYLLKDEGDMPSPNRGWMREQLAGVLNAFSISSI